MNIKKTVVKYSRQILGAILVIHLLLAWMYFSDNTQQLTIVNIVLWFIAVPVLLMGFIFALNTWKKSAQNPSSNADKSEENVPPIQPPLSYHLYIQSSVCLPEGSDWLDISNDQQDLTVLSDQLSDIDGMPVLTKPIPDIGHPIRATYDDEVPSDATLRVKTIMQALLHAHSETIFLIAEHLSATLSTENEHNAAIEAHPKWQQHYIVKNTPSATEPALPDSRPSIDLSVFLCLPKEADASILKSVLSEQLYEFTLPTEAFTIDSIIIEDNTPDHESDGSLTDSSGSPDHFINSYLAALSTSDTPKVCMLLIADSQISEDWVALNTVNASSIPTEAGVLLMFYNNAAQKTLLIDDAVYCAMTPANNEAVVQKPSHNETWKYAHDLATIREYLLHHRLSADEYNQNNTTNEVNNYDKNVMTDMDIILMSDINPVSQAYDTSTFMALADALLAQQALVNEHHLGHYMPLNPWLKPFIAISLFINHTQSDHTASDFLFLVTKHKPYCVLWHPISP